MIPTAAVEATSDSAPTGFAWRRDGLQWNSVEVEWRKVINWGGLCALGLVFIALSGMLVGLDGRPVLQRYFSLGYLAMVWLPLLLGQAVNNEVVREGIAGRPRGAGDLLAGATVGGLGGLGLGALILGIANFDLRDPLVNWSPQLLALLGFNQGNTFGFVVWILLGAALGMLGASLHLMGPDLRRLVGIVVGTVLFVAIFETIIVDLAKGFRLVFVTDFLYGLRGGLLAEGVVALAVVAGAAAVLGQGRIKEAKASLAALEGTERKWANAILLVVAAALLVIVPQFTGKITNELLANVGIFLLLALGLNIVVGLAGILDLGYVAFFAVGGYATAVLTSPRSNFLPAVCDTFLWFECEPASLPWALALVVVVIVAALTGLFIGAPVIRMRGDYLAIVTLGFGEIIRLLFLSDWLTGFFGGAQGVTNIPPADFGLFEVAGIDPRSVFYLVLFFCGVAIYISWRLERSRIGRAWMAIREDESVAEAMGINTVNMKLMAFVVGAILASFGGAIFAAKVGSIFPSSFLILVSIIILVVVIVGGIGNIPGVILGAVVLIGVLGGPKQPGLLQEFSQYKLLIYGALLIWMMLKRPEGLLPNARRTRELHQDEFLQDAWLKGEVDLDDDDPTGGRPAAEGTVPMETTPGDSASGEVAPA